MTPSNSACIAHFSPSARRKFALLPRERAAGFSLVEVALSLGIISFAFVGIVGLLPIGLNVSWQASDATVRAQIVQEVISEVQQTDFSVLTDATAKSSTDFFLSPPAANAPFYFDDQGNRITSAGAISSGNFIYEAGYAVTPVTTLPAGFSTQRLATITVCLLNSKARRTNFTEKDQTKNPDSKKYIVLLPDNGR